MKADMTTAMSKMSGRDLGRLYLKDAVGMLVDGTTAYTMTASSYVEAVKQVEVLLALAIGHIFFKETATIREIWMGTVVMLAGLVLLKLGT